MSNTAQAHVDEQRRYRQYLRNRHETEDTPGVVAVRGYDVDPSEMNDAELEKQYWILQRLRVKEFNNGDPRGLAIPIARRQNKLYDEAKDRDIADRFIDEDNSEFA